MPSPSQLPKYFMKKVQESIKSHSKGSILTKDLLSPRIPPSGTQIKLEVSGLSLSQIRLFSNSVKKEPASPSSPSLSSSSHTSSNPSDLEDIAHKEEYIQIGFLKPRFAEFTYIFPSFPKTHPDGYAYIIELSPEVLNEKAILSLRNALQYSLTGGGRPKTYENVKYFASEGKKVPMKIHSRQCAGATLRISIV